MGYCEESGRMGKHCTPRGLSCPDGVEEEHSLNAQQQLQEQHMLQQATAVLAAQKGGIGGGGAAKGSVRREPDSSLSTSNFHEAAEPDRDGELGMHRLSMTSHAHSPLLLREVRAKCGCSGIFVGGKQFQKGIERGGERETERERGLEELSTYVAHVYVYA